MLPSTALAGSVVALWADWPMMIDMGYPTAKVSRVKT
jgi:hypothetical protein